jgi:hypothetical protein
VFALRNLLYLLEVSVLCFCTVFRGMEYRISFKTSTVQTIRVVYFIFSHLLFEYLVERWFNQRFDFPEGAILGFEYGFVKGVFVHCETILLFLHLSNFVALVQGLFITLPKFC